MKKDISRSFEEQYRFVDYHGRVTKSKLKEESQQRKLRNDFLILPLYVIPLNLHLKALYKNEDENYGKILHFKNEVLVRVLEIPLEKGKYKKLNIVKEIENNTKSAYGGD